jgi:hypothetical protein
MKIYIHILRVCIYRGPAHSTSCSNNENKNVYVYIYIYIHTYLCIYIYIYDIKSEFTERVCPYRDTNHSASSPISN